MSTRDPAVEQTVYVVDDDPGMLQTLRQLLCAAGVRCETFERPGTLLERLDAGVRGCLLLDLQLPEKDGLDLRLFLTQAPVLLPAILISGSPDTRRTVQAMRSGAFGVIDKPFDGANLLEEIGRAFAFEQVMRQREGRRRELERRLGSLTPRERQVKDLLVAGDANKVIAMDLSMSERTVEVHRARVMEKLGVRSIAQLVRVQMECLAGEAGPQTGQ